MATAPAKPTPVRRTDPLTEFVQPGRRRTDHPLVVGTIVLCLGLITLGTIFQIVAQVVLARTIETALEHNEARVVETQKARAALVEHLRVQTDLVRRVCVNVARNPADVQDCVGSKGP
ncbi:MAG TPA: hypothetical protein VKA83_09340 [Methylomirabilota bacterium]|nr:hypothetical protein [Methylomirabilota bacterium]